MSEPERHGNVKLSSWVSRELRQKIIDYQNAKGMKTLTKAHIELLEKALSGDPKVLHYQTCPSRNEIPAYYLKFVDCIKRRHDDRIRSRQRVTQEQCMACDLFHLMELPFKTLDGLNLEIVDAKETLVYLEKQIAETDSKTLECLKEERDELKEDNEKKDLLIKAMKKELLSKGTPHEIIEEPKSQKLGESERIIKRIVEENKKTTEEFIPSQQHKKLADVICHKIADFVSVGDACKKCDEVITCPQYSEFVMLKKAIRSQ